MNVEQMSVNKADSYYMISYNIMNNFIDINTGIICKFKKKNMKY